jgi:hypothetical protein
MKRWALGLALLAWPADAQAQFADSDSIGWGNSESELTPPQEEVPRALWPHIDGRVGERAGLWLQRLSSNPLAQLRSSLQLQANWKYPFTVRGHHAELRFVAGARGEYDLAYRVQREDYDRATIDAYELRLIGLESYAGLQIGDLDVQSGRLIVTLGQGELLSTIDLVSPRDYRQLGLTPPDQVRLALLASRASLSLGPHRIEAIVIHESFFGMFPAPLSALSPLRKLITDDPLAGDQLAGYDWYLRHTPDRLDPRATRFVARYEYSDHGFDLALYAGSVLDPLGIGRVPAPSAFTQQRINADVQHPRFTMFAHSGAKSISDVVLRWEVSMYLKRPVQTRDTRYAALVLDHERLTMVNAMVGATYEGIADASLGLEVVQSLVIDQPTRKSNQRELLWPLEATGVAARWTQELWKQRLVINVVGTLIGVHPFNGALVLLSGTYRVRDNVSLTLDYVHYQASDRFGPLYGFGRNDRLDLSFLWSFSVL